MDDVSTAELVALHLENHLPDDSAEVARYERSTPGIGDVLGLDDTLSGRVELLTILTSMKEKGLLVEDRAHVEGLHGERNVYRLTDEGRQLVRDLHARLEGETVAVVQDGDTTSVRLDDIDEEFPDVTLVEALARTTDDGVLHRRDETHAPEGVVGRQSELTSLSERFETVQSGASETVLVAGESGVGKTTLVEHALQDARDRGSAVLTGTGNEDATQPYLPVRTALAEHREAFPPRLFEADTTAQTTDVTDLEDLADRRRSLFYDVGEGLTDLAADQPVALFLDDLHAADPGTLALLEYLATTIDDEPILLAGAYRPEELDADHPLQRLVADLDDGDHLELGPLAAPATRTLIERTLDDRDVPREFVDTVHTRTGGHPLFVEATVRQLHEQGVVDPRAGHYPADPDLPLPQEVRTAIERRLAALDDTARTVIDAASVVGTTVDFRVLATVTDLAPADLREYVDLLVAARIWTYTVELDGDAPADEGQLSFVNQVVRDAVREQLPDRKRRELHEQVAAALEQVHADELDANAGTIARHHEQAGDLESGIEYYRRAGEHAASVFAHETAVDNYERALALAREHDRQESVLSLMKHIGEVHLKAGTYEEAERYFGYVLEHADDLSAYWETAGQRALVRNKRGEYDDAIADVDRALARWDGETAVPEVRALLARKVWALYRKGEIERARDPAETQLALAARLDDPRERGDALNTLAAIERASGNPEEAIELLEEAIEVARAADERRLEAFSRNDLGVIYWRRDVEAALEMFEDCHRIHRETNNPWGEMLALGNVGSCLEQLCVWDRALARLEEAIERSRRLGTEQFVAANTVKIGTVYLERGELASAREYLDQGLELAEAVEYRLHVDSAHVALARLEYRQANLEAGEAHADAVLQPDESNEVVPQAYSVKGRLRLACDDLEGALSAHERGYERAIDIERPRSRIRNLCGLADVHRRAGRLEAAREQVTVARQTAAEQNNPLLEVETALAHGRVQRELTPGRAEETLQAALDDVREIGAKVHECEALYELGRLHGKRGGVANARESFEETLILAGETGGTLYERRSRSALDTLPGNS